LEHRFNSQMQKLVWGCDDATMFSLIELRLRADPIIAYRFRAACDKIRQALNESLVFRSVREAAL
jgi:hypothetical protein